MYYDEDNNYYDYIFKEKSEENIFDLDVDIDKINFDNDDYNLYNQMNFDIENINVNNFRHKFSHVSPIEGINKGTLFKEDYRPYKKYIYNIKVNGRKDEMLLKIQALAFAIKDLELYLDTHPFERDKIDLLRKYEDELREVRRAFGKEYHPISLSDLNNSQKFSWIDNPWPWDKGGSA